MADANPNARIRMQIHKDDDWRVDGILRLIEEIFWPVGDGAVLAYHHLAVTSQAALLLHEVDLRCLDQSIPICGSDPIPKTVHEIVSVSTEGRAPKNDPAIFALAMAAGLGDEATKRLALESLPAVCRTGTHLFLFAQFVESFRGCGVFARMPRRT